MRRMNRLTAGLLCAVLAAALVIPAAAHGHHGGRGYGHHGACAQPAAPQETQPQYVQPAVGVCPYDGCAETGRHYHDSVPYCGYSHAGAYCDGTCAGYCAGNDPAAGNVGSYAYYGCGFGYANGHGHHGGC
ncbi:hypothetical protein N510_002468 [Firmicutes bacterium ASF500]|nr:hypothetical protein N510_002468 [Firmicutes bacterium ASF500]